MIRTLSRRMGVAVAAAALVFAATTGLTPAAWAAKSKSTQNEAKWVKFDPATNTVVAEIQDRGNGPNAKMMKKGQQVTFNVKPTGSVLTRTSVAINGVKGELTDIREGKTVLIYWVPDENKDGEYFARKIDVVLSEEELDKRSEEVQ